MGIFSNIKEKMNQIFNRNKVKALNAAPSNETPLNTTMEDKDLCEQPSLLIGKILPSSTPNEHITIRDFKIDSINFETGNKLILARLGKARNGVAEALYTGDYVAFEIEKGAKLDFNMLKKLASYYEYASQMTESFNKECCYYGILNKDKNDLFRNKDFKVQRYVERAIIPKIRAEEEAIRRRDEMRYKPKEEPKKDEPKQFSLSAEELEKGIEAQRLEKVGKIKELYLKQSGSYYDEAQNQYHDYNATDTYTGDFLQIKKLNKVAKDENGRYIYTAFLGRTSSLYNAVYQDKNGIPVGSIPVCFTMDSRFEDVVKNQNPTEMKALLDMLSSRETFDRSYGVLNYIGCLEKSGNVNRDIYNNSPAIVSTINNLQHQFYLQNQRTNEGQEK